MAGLTIATVLTGCAGSLHGGSPMVTGASAYGDYRIPVASVDDRRYAGVIRQRYDFSCGSAALATLLRYHYDYAVAEEAAFRGMWAKGDRTQIRRLGFSLLDMKRWLASHNLRADGYKVSLDDIAKAGVPGIALISIKNYRHFVVVKGVHADEVLLGDPSAGLTMMKRDSFKMAWNGVYFVLAPGPAGKPGFNRATQWAAVGRAPLGHAFADPVSLQALSLTAPFRGDF